MIPNDDDLMIAFALAEHPEPSEDVKAAFAALGQAPLSTLIGEMLVNTPGTHLKAQLQCIATLNQGSLEHLDASDFVSYIIRKTGMTESTLKDCRRALRSYVLTRDMAITDNRTLLAARTDDASSRKSALISDVARELRRRK